jgi:hypothetical protein
MTNWYLERHPLRHPSDSDPSQAEEDADEAKENAEETSD